MLIKLFFIVSYSCTSEGSADGFPIVDEPRRFKSGSGQPHDEDCIDPSLWDDSNLIFYDSSL